MATTFTMKVENPGQVRRQLGPLRTALAVKLLGNAVTTAAILVEERAQRNAPTAFGLLRASITHGALEVSGHAVTAAVGTPQTSGPFVEFGTGPAGANSKLSDLARKFMADTGYRHGPHGGWPPDDAIEMWMRRKGIGAGLDALEFSGLVFMIQRSIYAKGSPAQPFLFPALEESTGDINAMIARAMKTATESTV